MQSRADLARALVGTLLISGVLAGSATLVHALLDHNLAVATLLLFVVALLLGYLDPAFEPLVTSKAPEGGRERPIRPLEQRVVAIPARAVVAGDDQALARLLDREIPTVLVDSSHPQLTSIVLDETHGARLAAGVRK